MPILGQEDYDRLRPLSYPGSHIALLCFSIADPDSHEPVCTRWMPELHHFLPDIPVVLVACKTDLRENQRVLDTLARQGKTPMSEAEVSFNTLKPADGTYMYMCVHAYSLAGSCVGRLDWRCSLRRVLGYDWRKYSTCNKVNETS